MARGDPVQNSSKTEGSRSMEGFQSLGVEKHGAAHSAVAVQVLEKTQTLCANGPNTKEFANLI